MEMLKTRRPQWSWLAGVLLAAALPAGSAQASTSRPWDESVALAVARALNGPVTPGIKYVEHKPAQGWKAELSALDGSMLYCAAPPAGLLDCNDRGFSQDSKPLAGAKRIDGLGAAVTAFVTGLKVPASRYARVEVMQQKSGVVLLLHQTENALSSQRIIGRWGDEFNAWVVTEPLSEGLEFEISMDPIAVPGGKPEGPAGRLIVLKTADGGHGNNASGTISFRGLIVTSTGEPVVRIAHSVDFGNGMWGRSVTSEGFLVGSKANFLCPAPTTGGFTLTETCPKDVDPRGFHTFATWCSQPCKRGRKLQDQAGRYMVRGGVVRKARANSIRPVRKGDLLTTEIAEGFQYIELKNKARDAVVLSGLVIATVGDDGYPLFIGDCIADAGELIVVADSLWVEDAQLDPSAVCFADSSLRFLDPERPFEIRVGLGVEQAFLLEGRLPPMPERELMEDAEPPLQAWQVDSRGRECVREASPGRENPPCR